MKTVKLVFAWVVFAFSGTFVNAQTAPVNDHGVAIGGYDVVSYFSGEAKQGNEKYASDYKGTTYYFSSKSNKNAFKKAPEKYVPQFGGYCAWGVGAKSALFPINPETFDIIDGKLYLFFNGPFDGQPFNAKIDWTNRTTTLKAAAHKNWPMVMKSSK